ncbi:MAG: hypothetical protein GX493_11005, partial [Firmicutes bacterium]|nr:hypothetical protein [Bacillota bacterium]
MEKETRFGLIMAIMIATLVGSAIPGGRSLKAAGTIQEPLLPNPPVIARSPDEQHLVWAQLTPDGKSIMIIDGQAQPGEYDEIHHLVTFSPDGKRIAYMARKGAKWSVVVDGRAGPEYLSLSYLTFSPDGKRLAYGATKGDQWFVVLDGKEMSTLHSFVAYLTFSPDGRRFAYAADSGTKQFMVVDGRAGPEYDATGEPVFSPDGRHIAYVAMDSDKKRCVVLDGKEGEKYDWIEKPVFSADGEHIAYSVRKGDKSLVVVDGWE